MFLVLGGLRCLKTSSFEFLQKDFGVVIRALIVIILVDHHRLNEVGALNSILIFLRVFLNYARGVVLKNVDLDAELLIEAHVGVVAEEAVEGEFAGATEALLHLELANILAIVALEALDLDNILFGCGVHNHEIPVGSLEVGVSEGADVAGALVLRQVVVLESDFERDNIRGGDGFLTFDLNLVASSYEGKGLDNFLELIKLGSVSAKESELCALGRRKSAECLNLAVRDLMFS